MKKILYYVCARCKLSAFMHLKHLGLTLFLFQQQKQSHIINKSICFFLIYSMISRRAGLPRGKQNRTKSVQWVNIELFSSWFLYWFHLNSTRDFTIYDLFFKSLNWTNSWKLNYIMRTKNKELPISIAI